MCRARRRWSFAPATTRVGSATPSAVVVVRAFPVLFPARFFCRGWPFKRTALCTLQAPFATSAVATSAASLRPRGKAHGRRLMRPLCRPSAWSPCASCSTAPAPLSSAISSCGSSSALPEPALHARLPAFAYRRCSCSAAHVQSDPPHATDATHICLPCDEGRAWQAAHPRRRMRARICRTLARKRTRTCWPERMRKALRPARCSKVGALARSHRP